MANTTNFGWETPDDTDLVKDGAAAMRTLGSAIDTSLVDLKGGTTGQNLRKNSNTDMDFTWAGDATNTVIDAEGDLLVGDSADTLQRLAIGTTGQILTVDTAVDGKIKWAAGGNTFVGSKVYNSGTQSMTHNTYTLVTFDSESFDSDGFHSTVTNTGRFTIPSGKDGKYRITFYGTLLSMVADKIVATRIYKNGAGQEITYLQVAYANDLTAQISSVHSAVAGDYFEIYINQNTGTAKNIEGGANNNWFSIEYLGA